MSPHHSGHICLKVHNIKEKFQGLFSLRMCFLRQETVGNMGSREVKIRRSAWSEGASEFLAVCIQWYWLIVQHMDIGSSTDGNMRGKDSEATLMEKVHFEYHCLMNM